MDTDTPAAISPRDFIARIGRPDAPLVLDVRRDVRFDESDRIAPGAQRCAPERVADFARSAAPQEVVVYCVHGLEVGRDAASQLRAAGWNACYLQGGIDGLVDAGLPTIRKRPDLGVTGMQPSRWITRSRPKIDRIACPWLIRRFIDTRAQFFYVPQEKVQAEARQLEAVPFDIDNAPITHQWEKCSFDALIAAFDLKAPALDALAMIVRGADTSRPDIAPQAAGLLAISLGLSHLNEDDHAMLEAAMPVYDALYAWCRDAREETHNWVAHT